jgi:cysteine desulfurase
MNMATAYFDFNATAPVKPGVAAVIADALAVGGNPSSVHRSGRRAHAMIDTARDQVAALAGTVAKNVVFTSGGTEANNLALDALADTGRRIVVSAIEHPSILAMAGQLDGQVIAVGEDGVVDLARLEENLAADETPALVSIMFANNETGICQPVAEAVEIAHRYGALLHCDAVQAPGRVALDMTALDIDLMSLSAHKLGGPMGCGALVVLPRAGKIAGMMQGGGQERGLRAGTENLPGIAGFGCAAELASDDLAGADELGRLRDDMEARLQQAAPGARIIGKNAVRLNNTTCITMPGVESETQVMALDLAGVAVSAGSACSSGKVTRSHVLENMAIDPRDADCAIRISLGWQTTAAEVDRMIGAWTELYGRLQSNDVTTEKHAMSAA